MINYCLLDEEVEYVWFKYMMFSIPNEKKALSSKAAVNPMLVNRRNKENCTPLQLACIMDRADCVKELLKVSCLLNNNIQLSCSLVFSH